MVTLVLSGVIVGSMFAAGVSMLKYLANEAALRDIVFWLMGGFYFASWQDVAIVGAGRRDRVRRHGGEAGGR